MVRGTPASEQNKGAHFETGPNPSLEGWVFRTREFAEAESSFTEARQVTTATEVGGRRNSPRPEELATGRRGAFPLCRPRVRPDLPIRWRFQPADPPVRPQPGRSVLPNARTGGSR